MYFATFTQIKQEDLTTAVNVIEEDNVQLQKTFRVTGFLQSPM